ncbi:MAG: PKD domain-containing protein [Bacteroidetes bacterium]|nr:MAG: PKD domain-containing protein [Bacteroidota bacterium]
MKKHRKKLILIIFLLQFSFLQAQWVDRGKYKEIKIGTESIKQIVIPSDTNLIYAVDDSNYITKVNIDDGIIIERKNIDSVLNYKFSRISNDGKSRIYFNKIGDDFHTYRVDIVIYEIQKDSILINMMIDTTPFYYNYTIRGEFFADYNLNLNSIFIVKQYTSLYQHAGITSNYADGFSVLVDAVTDSAKFLVRFRPINFIFDADYQNFIFSTYEYKDTWDRDTGPMENTEDRRFSFYDEKLDSSILISQNYKDALEPDKNIYGTVPEQIDLSNDSIINGFKGSTIYLYKFFPEKVVLIDSILLDYQPIEVKFSGLSKYLICSSPLHQINVLHIPTKTIIDKFILQDNQDVRNITLTNDSQGFIAGNTNGIIKYFQPKYFYKEFHALFTSDKTEALPEMKIKFVDISTGEPNYWEWDFGDGEKSTEQYPIHSYKLPGNYSVKLIAKKNNFYDTLFIADYITVYPVMKADFESDLNDGFSPMTTQFSNKSIGNIKYYKWYFSDGDSSEEKEPLRTFTKPGKYDITLIVSDGMFNDTCIKREFIKIGYKALDKSVCDKELINTNPDQSLSGTNGFESNDGGYFAESNDNNKSVIYRFNNSFDTLWTKSFYTNNFYRPIQKSNFDGIFAIGTENYDLNNVVINEINNNGNKIYSKILDNVKYAFDFISGNGIIIIKLKGVDSTNDNYIAEVIEKYDDNFNLLWSEILNRRYKLKCTSLKGQQNIFSDYSVFSSLHSYMDVDYDYYFSYIFEFNEVGQATDTFYIDNLLDVQINDYIQTDWNNFVVIIGNKSIYSINKNLKNEINWEQQFSNISYNGLCYIDDKYFFTCGSKDSLCWFALMDTSGNIINEYTLPERYGALNSISQNKDSSLLLTGYLKKNQNMNSLYILKTNPQIFSDFKDISKNIKCKVYPNPSENVVKFLLNLSSEIYIKLNVKDILGNQVALLADGYYSGECNFKFDSYSQSTGIFFYQLQIGSTFESGKFMIIR